jgi:hypothetical protein
VLCAVLVHINQHMDVRCFNPVIYMYVCMVWRKKHMAAVVRQEIT